MEQLNPKQKEYVSKMSTVRLTAKLIQIGHTEDELADLERADLQTLYAKAIYYYRGLISRRQKQIRLLQV